MWSGYIYKIHCNITGEDYYGSTECDIEKRIMDHVAHVKCDTMVRKCTSSQIIERGDWCYEIMEEVDYIIKTDLYIRERYYFDNYPCINIYKPYRTAQDYKEKWEKQNKKYRSNPENVRRIKERAKTVIECGCGTSYTKACTARHLRSEAHKYFVENGVPLERKLEIIKCECGGHYEIRGKNRHIKSKKHQRYIDNN